MGFLDEDNFDARNIEQPENDFSALPAGWYDVAIHSVEFKTGTGIMKERLELRLDVTGPTYQGRVLFWRIMTESANPDPEKKAKGEQLGAQQYSKLALAVNKPTVRKRNIQELVGCRLKVKVKVKPASGDYKEGNEITDAAPLEGAVVPFTGAPKPAATPTTSGFPAGMFGKK